MNFRKALSLAAAVTIAAGSATTLIAGEDSPVLALSGAGEAKGISAGAVNTFGVDFVAGGTAAAGVNFDVIIEGDFNKRSDGGVSITDCGGSVAGSHVARCELVAPNRIRVLVFSAPVSELPTASLVSFSVNGSVKDVRIDAESTAVSDLNGGMIQAEVL